MTERAIKNSSFGRKTAKAPRVVVPAEVSEMFSAKNVGRPAEKITQPKFMQEDAHHPLSYGVASIRAMGYSTTVAGDQPVWPHEGESAKASTLGLPTQ